MKRGMTLLEICISLTLLTALMLAVLGWVRIPSRLTARLTGPLRIECAAEALLQHIHDDVMTGDFSLAGSQSRLTVRDDVLKITTRRGSAPGGSTRREYSFDARAGQLVVTEHLLGDVGPSPAKVMLGGVSRWLCRIDAQRKYLSMRIELSEGDTRSVRIRL